MINIIKESLKIIIKGEYRWIPASLAFYFIISFLPLLFGLCLFVIKYFINDLTLLDKIMALNNSDIDLRGFVFEIKNNFIDTSILISMGLFLISLFFSCNGFRGIMYAIESLYDLKKLSFFKSYLYAIILNVSILLIIIIMLILTNLLPIIFTYLNINLKLNYYFIILLLIIFIIIYLSYGLVSDFKLRLNNIYPGLIFTSISIFLIILLSNYLFALTRFSFLYGSLAFVILLAHFFFYMSYVIYIGIVINVVFLKNKHHKNYHLS
ncbi:MAG: YihY/virulence factor BrkB family protein [Bacilli bacterium]|jgi:uncharacterized BrkB/YihY/UPF0761 family membrane protein|nr:YihY/virulence factor BrkB family protein [Bacilli bacterium]